MTQMAQMTLTTLNKIAGATIDLKLRFLEFDAKYNLAKLTSRIRHLDNGKVELLLYQRTSDREHLRNIRQIAKI